MSQKYEILPGYRKSRCAASLVVEAEVPPQYVAVMKEIKHIFALQKQSYFTIKVIPQLIIMLIERKQYVDRLLSKRWNGKVKIITGIRRCGKSFLLDNLADSLILKEKIV